MDLIYEKIQIDFIYDKAVNCYFTDYRALLMDPTYDKIRLY